MIKTHKPRGHIWTHSSKFQQTKEYREIHYEDCIPPPAKVLVADADDQLSRSQRETKRRKIEKLADDFLNGEPLYISSARPCPQALKSTIVRNKRTSGQPKYRLPEIEPATESSAVWEEVPDDLELLRTATRRSKATKPPPKSDAVASGIIVIEESRAQARCSPARDLRASEINIGPSDEALKQAAALRARRVQRANSEVPAISRLASRLEPMIEDSEEREPRSEPRLRTVDRDLTRRTNDWLSRRSSRLCMEAQDAGESSVDELRLSAIETPSRLVRGLSTRSDRAASYHTAPEDTEFLVETVKALISEPNSQEDSQSRLLRSHGVQTKHRPSFTSMNETAKAHNESPSIAAAMPADGNASLSAVHHSLLESANFSAGKATKGKRARSAARATPQQSRRVRSAPTTTSQDSASEMPPPATTSARALRGQAAKPVYESISTEDSPFKMRRRGLGPHDGDARQAIAAVQEQKRKTGRAIKFPSSDLSETEDQSVALDQRAHAGMKHPPILDMSFGHDSSFAPELNMALVDEHLNKVLPTEPNSAGKASAVKKSLRRQLRDSGAEISRCASEPPTSPCAEPAAEPWLGTQAVLRQAEKDLLTSPEKHPMEHAANEEATPRLTNTPPATEPPPAIDRSPLKQLSQEPLPSTQALLGDWQGFSTVKKPRWAHRASLEPTPTAAKGASGSKGAPSQSRLSSSSLSESILAIYEPEKRQSTLRFSTTSLATPVPSPMPLSSRKSAMKSSTTSAADTTTNADHIVEGASQSFSTTAVPFSSFHAAQASLPQIEPPTLLRDDSNPEGTMDDLARDVLGMSDMDGVLSQVG